MYSSIKKFAPILFISAFVVAVLNYLSYQAIIQIAQAQTDTIPTMLIVEIIATIAIHTIALAVVPLILSATNRKLTSYVALVILGALYTTFMTGMNAAGPVITIILFGYLAYYGYTKAQGIINHYLTK
jgi:hypothetical protein